MPATGDSVRVNPLEQFRASDPMQLYFEVSGTPHDSAYRLELAVKRPGGSSLLRRILGLFGGSGGAMRLAFTQRSPGGREVVRREISLEKLNPASYVLEVTVVTPAGKKVIRSQRFEVVR
jgi:hypothetical protein